MKRSREVDLIVSPTDVAIDLISRLDTTVSQAKHHVFEVFVLPPDHPERDQVAERLLSALDLPKGSW